jgi:putative spermidine/putrescine transport system permease protein
MRSGSLATGDTHAAKAGLSLEAELRLADRQRRFAALTLVTPLLVYVGLIFVVPIGILLIRSVYDPTIATLMPHCVEALQTWDERAPPGEPVYAALAADLKSAQMNQTVGRIGQRINFELPGTRSAMVATARRVARMSDGPYRETIIDVDSVWADREVWQTIKRAARTVTPTYLLRTIDVRVDHSGGLVAAGLEEAVFLPVLGRTLKIAGMVTLLTLVLGYPVAYLLASLLPKHRNMLLILVLLPFFTSLLVRTTAWVVLLQSNGVINDTLMSLGIITSRLEMIFHRTGTVVAMTHIQLPFTILPIYSVMLGISPALVRAARSLGASPFVAFYKVYIPQTMPGVGAGCLLTFILSLGYYITPALVGGPNDQMVSSFIAQYMNRELNWGMASALGTVLLFATLAIYMVYTRVLGVDRLRLG